MRMDSVFVISSGSCVERDVPVSLMALTQKREQGVKAYISGLKGPSIGRPKYSACTGDSLDSLALTCSRCKNATCSSSILGRT